MQAPLVILDHVEKYFGRHHVVSDMSLAIGDGEIVALVGQTGAGKSTVTNLVLGQYPPTSGAVRVDGHDPFRTPRALRGTMAVSFQADRLIPWRTARRNVELGLEILGVPRAARQTRAAEWLHRVKLAPEHHDKYPHQLSGGMRQRVSLARAMVVDPRIIILDESFSQLDPVTSSLLRADFLQIVKALGKTCLLVTHRIEDAIDMCSRILLLKPPGRIHLDIAVADAERRDRTFVDSLVVRLGTAMGPQGAQDLVVA